MYAVAHQVRFPLRGGTSTDSARRRLNARLAAIAGPAFQKIARVWKGRKDAEAMLVATIRKGSSGTGGPHWNKATMPDQAERPTVSEAEAKQLVAWILRQ